MLDQIQQWLTDNQCVVAPVSAFLAGIAVQAQVNVWAVLKGFVMGSKSVNPDKLEKLILSVEKVIETLENQDTAPDAPATPATPAK